MGDDVVSGASQEGDKEPVQAERVVSTAGGGSNGETPEAGGEVSAPDSAQREARETLAAITAAMAERKKQPLRKSDSLGGTLSIAEIEAMERQPTGNGAPSSGEKTEPVVPPPDSTTPQEIKQRPPLKLPKLAKPVNKKIVGLFAVCGVLSGAAGILIGSQYRTEHKVIYGLSPVKDAGFGKGRTIGLRANGENPVADIVAEALPTVVNIDMAPPPITENGTIELPSKGFTLNLTPRFHGRQSDSGNPPRSLGTGVIIRSDGYVVTSSHVVRAVGNRIVVTLNDKRSFDAKIVGKDSFTDLALLKIDADNLPVARFGTSVDLRPGDWAIAVGSPFGYDHTVTLGIISAVGRSISDLNNHVDLIQTDAAINPGNSGGPLLNIRGEVVGINCAVRTAAQNIGFAVPVDVVRTVADELLAHGTIKRPFLGIFMQDLNPYVAQQLQLKVNHGVIVGRIVPDSPCEKAGVGQNDIIVSVDGQKVDTTKEVREILKKCSPGEVMEFVFYRKGSGEEKRKVVIGNYPEE